MFVYLVTKSLSRMDVDILFDILKYVSEEALKLLDEFIEIADNDGQIYCFRLFRILNFLAPIIAAVVIYHYLKYLLIFNAYQYEEYMRKRAERMKKVSRQLRHLAKRYGSMYFYYMPMNHGIVLPKTYTLFMAIKDVLMNSNRPATRVLRSNLLMDLLHADLSCSEKSCSQTEMRERELLEVSHDDADPLSEFSLDLMKCSRELIIQGIKDFDVMSTVYRVLETFVEDSN